MSNWITASPASALTDPTMPQENSGSSCSHAAFRGIPASPSKKTRKSSSALKAHATKAPDSKADPPSGQVNDDEEDGNVLPDQDGEAITNLEAGEAFIENVAVLVAGIYQLHLAAVALRKAVPRRHRVGCSVFDRQPPWGCVADGVTGRAMAEGIDIEQLLAYGHFANSATDLHCQLTATSASLV